MTVWHFGEAMNDAKGQLRTTPTLNALADWKAISAATKTFTKYFDMGEQLRHLRDAISHPTELH